MSSYFGVLISLVVTISAFLLIAALVRYVRTKGLAVPGFPTAPRIPAAPRALTVEQTCAIDTKRRLLLVQCHQQRFLLLTGGPTDHLVALTSGVAPLEQPVP